MRDNQRISTQMITTTPITSGFAVICRQNINTNYENLKATIDTLDYMGYSTPDSSLPEYVLRNYLLRGLIGAVEVYQKDNNIPVSAFESLAETALWASTDNDDEPLSMCKHRLSRYANYCLRYDFCSFLESIKLEGLDPDLIEAVTDEDINKVAHDFWLTRNKHGAGFWDGDYGDLGDVLTNVAHQFEECMLYVTDLQDDEGVFTVELDR